MKRFERSVAVVLAILGPSIILRALAMDILLSCVPALAQYFQVPFSTTQWLLSIYFIGAGIGQLVVGPLADEYGRRKVLIYSTILIIVTSLACTQITDIYLMMLMRLLQGFGACGTTVVSMAIMRDLYDDEALAKVYSYFNSIIALAPLLAPLLGGYLMMQTGTWRATFYFITAFSIVALAIDYYLVPETNPAFTGKKTFVKVPILKSYKTLLADWEFLGYCCFDVMGMSSMFLFFSMSSILLIQILGIDPHTFGYYFGATSALYLLGNMVSPYLQTKLNIQGTIRAGSVLMVAGGLAMFFVDRLYGLSVLGIIIPNAISTFGVGLLFGPSMAGVVKNYKHIAGIASAAYGAIFLGGSALLIAGIMQLEIVDGTILALNLALMGSINILVLQALQLSRKSRKAKN